MTFYSPELFIESTRMQRIPSSVGFTCGTNVDPRTSDILEDVCLVVAVNFCISKGTYLPPWPFSSHLLDKNECLWFATQSMMFYRHTLHIHGLHMICHRPQSHFLTPEFKVLNQKQNYLKSFFDTSYWPSFIQLSILLCWDRLLLYGNVLLAR